ncbi:MAG TPA: hypothetical protein VG870_15430 [Chitinophagaceae bacterium]|nr:hypothetical protein [Chitinophagaceae bacterium]
MSKVVRLDDQELQQLTQEVKETLATSTEYLKKNTDNFTAIDMWNCHRRVRSASSLMRRWNS